MDDQAPDQATAEQAVAQTVNQAVAPLEITIQDASVELNAITLPNGTKLLSMTGDAEGGPGTDREGADRPAAAGAADRADDRPAAWAARVRYRRLARGR